MSEARPRLVARAAAACRGCGRSTRRGNTCDDCRSARPSAAKRGYSSPHRKRRAAFLAANPWCADGCGETATVLDHVIPLAQGGADDESNWQGLTAAHHSRKTARQSSGWGRVIPLRRRR